MIPNNRDCSVLTNSNEPQLISITLIPQTGLTGLAGRGCNSYQQTAPRAVTARLPPLPHVALVTRATHALYPPSTYTTLLHSDQTFLSGYLSVAHGTNERGA